MTLYIDPPRWPAHGTVFSHLISDAQLEELHHGAHALGLSPRAFDLDHYDVPAHRYEAALDLGAVPVDGKRLVTLLRASGLRVPARQRPSRLAATLTARWARRFPQIPELAAPLVHRWSEPHRHYHALPHLLSVLESLELLCAPARPSDELVAAAWYHDAVYRGHPGRDEVESAQLARTELHSAGWSTARAQRVADLVAVTTDHRPAEGDDDAALLVDADLAILGAPVQDYRRYTLAVRREYAHVPPQQFAVGRLRVLEALWDSPLYLTPRARTLWAEQARANLSSEITALRAER